MQLNQYQAGSFHVFICKTMLFKSKIVCVSTVLPYMLQSCAVYQKQPFLLEIELRGFKQKMLNQQTDGQ
jgi:hypothetical protein